MAQGTAVKVLAGLIALQTLVGGVALATVDTRADGGRLLAAEDPAATTAPASGAGEPAAGAPGGPAPGAASSAGSDQPAGRTSAGNDQTTIDYNALPERPGPPRPGVYRYRTKFDGQAGFGTYSTEVEDERESDTTFEAAGSSAGEVRDRERYEGSGSFGGFNVSGAAVRDRAWRDDGMYATKEEAEAQSQGEGDEGPKNHQATCDWQPDMKQLAFPLREGTTWTWDSTCESNSEDFEMKRRSQGSSKVTGTRVASVAGQEVRVLVIETTATEDTDTRFRYDGEEYQSKGHTERRDVTLYAPSVGLPVRSDFEMNGTFDVPQAPGQQGRMEGEGYTELLGLDPE